MNGAPIRILVQREYYACDALYRNWYTSEAGNLEVPATDLSSEEQDAAIRGAQQALDSAFALLNSECVVALLCSRAAFFISDCA